MHIFNIFKIKIYVFKIKFCFKNFDNQNWHLNYLKQLIHHNFF